jgi:saccharopine dehydrogenase (NAD+, L-lysine-forming)
VSWLIYGANGYTGELVARLAVRRGERPLLAGRHPTAVAALAADLGLDHEVVPLSDATGLRRLLERVDVVAHCAGPFSATAAPMIAACLDTGTHYLDITGEIGVLEAAYAVHDRAVDAGVVLVPGAGFDVVPTDCTAARLAAALPGATSLELAFVVGGGMSGGTLRSSLEGMAAGGVRRVDGELVSCPPGEPARDVPFPSGTRRVGGVRWGDLASAYRSTGIPTITTYTSLPGTPLAVRLLREPARWAMRVGPVRSVVGALGKRVRRGPDDALRARTRCEVWGEVRDAAGRAASTTLAGPNAYDLTADAVVRAVARLSAGDVPPGAHTPATAFGADFAGELDGVTLGEVAVGA